MKNNTNGYSVPVTKSNGTIQKVAKGTATIRPATSGTSAGNISGGYWGGGSSGSYQPSVPSVPTYKVTNQKTLEEKLTQARNTGSEMNIRIEDASNPADNSDITIGSETDKYEYSKVTLIVDSPTKTIKNYAHFAGIEILKIKDETWHEFGMRSKFNISAPKSSVIAEKGAEIASVTYPRGAKAEKAVLKVLGKILEGIRFEAPVKNTSVAVDTDAEVGDISFVSSAADADVKVDLKGKITNGVTCGADAKLTMTVAGSTASAGKITVTAGMDVTIKAAAGVVPGKDNSIDVTLNDASAKLTAEVPVEVKANKEDVTISLSGAAEGSVIIYAKDVEKTTIITNVPVTIKDAETDETTVIENANGPVYIDGTIVNLSDTELSILEGKTA